jgi:hypothetical protein
LSRLRKTGYICLVLFFVNRLSSQQNLPQLTIKQTSEKIAVDGVLNEPVWQTTQKADNFWQNFPYDTCLAVSKTEVSVTYNTQNLYISAICWDSLPGKNIVQSLKRDFSYPVSDAFVVSIDPFSDMQNGFSFGVNPYNAQREGLIAFGGGVITIWDNKWYSAVKRGRNCWVVEMAIPFKTLRFKGNLSHWKINFARNDLKRNENSTWVKVPRQFNIATLAFTGLLNFEDAPKKTGGNVSIIPYGIARFSKDYQKNTAQILEFNAGADAKIVLGSSLNLDITVNPDFSQVEVDRQITNLSRFSLFFPEQRQFFIENSDLFERFGFRQIRPFFSRRIGLNNGSIVPIIVGARLSGKPGKNWRLGIMDMQTAETTINNFKIYSQNYFVAAVQRNVFKRSNVAAIFVNRQQIDTTGVSVNNYNRVAGLDFNLSSADNRINGKLFFHHSFTNNLNANAFAHASWVNYNDKNWLVEWNHEYVDKNYNAETGFTPRIFQPDSKGVSRRLSYWRFEPISHYYWYPKKSIINKLGPTLYIDHYRNEQFIATDLQLQPGFNIFFSNTSSLVFYHNYLYTKLNFPTDVTFSGRPELLPAGNYYYNNAFIQFRSNTRKLITTSLSFNYGSYYSGNKFSFGGDIAYRLQPYAIFSINYTRDQIYMPYLTKSVDLDLISPRIEMSFTRSLFLTTFWQYNSQSKNINFNGRLQWRFKPMSDLFFVYSDNYENNDFSIKNRAIVLKFVYWFSA